MGNKLPNGEFTGTIPAMAHNVGLRIKSMVCSGSEDQEAINKLLGVVLRYKWEPQQDLIGITLRFNISEQRKGKCQEPDLSLSNIEQLKSVKHTRTLLRICNGAFDTIMIASPYSIKLKILMKDTLNIKQRFS